MKTKYSSTICGLTVKSRLPFIAYGPVRGLISEHRTLEGARKSVQRDHYACRKLAGGNAYSDASAFQFDTSKGWIIPFNH